MSNGTIDQRHRDIKHTYNRSKVQVDKFFAGIKFSILALFNSETRFFVTWSLRGKYTIRVFSFSLLFGCDSIQELIRHNPLIVRPLDRFVYSLHFVPHFC